MLIINRHAFITRTSAQEYQKFIAILQAKKIPFHISEHEQKLLAEEIFAKQEKDAGFSAVNKEFIAHENTLTAYWVTGDKVPSHLSIECAGDLDWNEIFYAIEQGIKILNKAGYKQYTFNYNEGTKTLVFIPAEENGKQVDIRRKVSNMAWLFFQQDSFFKDNLPPLKPIKNDGPIVASPFQSSTTWTGIAPLVKDVETRLSKWIENEGYIFQNNESYAPAAKPADTFPITVKGCAFDREHVIRNQLILDLGPVLMLVNYRPYIGDLAFLVIPTRHIEDWSQLTTEEIEVLPKAIPALIKAIKQNCKVSDVEIMLNVNSGSQGGQTSEHLPIHTLVLPKSKYYSWLVDIDYQMTFLKEGAPIGCLTPAQMKTIAKTFAPIVYQQLKIEQGPHKSLTEVSTETSLVSVDSSEGDTSLQDDGYSDSPFIC